MNRMYKGYNSIMDGTVTADTVLKQKDTEVTKARELGDQAR